MKWFGLGVSCAMIVMSGCNPGGGGSSTASAAGATMLSYGTDVKPILYKHCGDCHLDGSKKGGYSLDSHLSAIEAGSKGPRIVAGSSAESNLVKRIRAEEGVKRMPPKGDLLTAAEVATISAWIDQGASKE